MTEGVIFPRRLYRRGVSGAMRSEEVLLGDTRDVQSSRPLSAVPAWPPHRPLLVGLPRVLVRDDRKPRFPHRGAMQKASIPVAACALDVNPPCVAEYSTDYAQAGKCACPCRGCLCLSLFPPLRHNRHLQTGGAAPPHPRFPRYSQSYFPMAFTTSLSDYFVPSLPHHPT